MAEASAFAGDTPAHTVDAGVFQDTPRLIGLVGVDHDALLQKTDRPFEYAHILIGDEAGNPGIAHQRFDKGDDHGIVGADEFYHRMKFAGCIVDVNAGAWCRKV